MACKGCEERREKVKELYEQAKYQLRYAIDLLRANRTKQSADQTDGPSIESSDNGNHSKQPTDTT